MSKKFEKLEDKRALAFHYRDGKWYAGQKIKIKGELYEGGERIPDKYAADYKRSNKLTDYWNTTKNIADLQDMTVEEVREAKRESIKINKFYSKYEYVFLDNNGRYRDVRTGEYVKEDKFLKEMKKKYPEIVKQKSKKDRVRNIEELKSEWFNS